MHKFLKIATQMFPAERIETIDRHANINGEIGIEVKLFGIPEVFQYTGQYASLALDVLNGINPAKNPPPIIPIIGGEDESYIKLDDMIVNANAIEWVDFLSNLTPTQQGIELRLATDAPGVTRKFVGKHAEIIYDVLVFLASNLEAAVNN